ncbi:MAG: hypothetical protein MJB14_12435 [Spirochaetes bacterium]|nr:hypothetical protein [Spirochaetota bacterium]
MTILTFGDIIESGNSVFTSITRIDEEELTIEFKGSIRVHNPYKFLSHYIEELEEKLKIETISKMILDFSELKFCNSSGFYVLMDIIEMAYMNSSGSVLIKRLKNDDWHQETLPILLDIDEPAISNRSQFEEVVDI